MGYLKKVLRRTKEMLTSDTFMEKHDKAHRIGKYSPKRKKRKKKR